MKTTVAAVILGLFLILAVVGALAAWRFLGDVDISLNGLIAMGLGIILTFGLGAGLMFLVFYSSRHGHDDLKRPME